MSEIDLQPFCGTDKNRFYLMKPWSRAGFTWATDGHILVRVPLRQEVDPQGSAPAAERVLDPAHDGIAEFAPLPIVEWPKASARPKCEFCEGRGVEHDCPECTCECDECGGSGLDLAPTSVCVGGIFFSSVYIRMIGALPNPEIGLKSKKGYPTPFRFDGGVGVVMRMNGISRLHHFGDIENLPRKAA